MALLTISVDLPKIPKIRLGKKRAFDTDITNPSEILAIGAKTASGETVTSENSLKFTAVLQAVSLTGALMASFPKQVFETVGTTKNELKDSLWKLLAHRPNSWMNAFTFWELNSTYMDLWGNAYNIITRRGGVATSLNPIHPSFVKVMTDDKGRVFYRVSGTNSSLDRDYKMMDVLHFKDLSTDGLTGKSRIGLARESIGLGLAAEQFGATFFGKGGHSDAVLEVEGVLGDAARKVFVESWQKNKNHGTPLLENGIKYKGITIPPDDAQFLATREFQVQDVSRIFNIPPPLLFDLSHATFSNIEAQNLQFLTYTMRPRVERFETEIEWKLIPEDQIGKQEVRFNLNDLLRGDTAARAALYASGIANRWLSPNEVRAYENLNPYPDGDKYENPNTTSKNNNNGTD
jgi:HK97 family phage portal protein